ncbi:MAG TPA: hypothetical protein ENK88_01990 [Campylobacterales bacterium]|nr:hypothetical protein [Campylobacterales bacterium]
MSKIFTITNLAKEYNIDIATIRNWLKQEQFPTIKKNNRHYSTSKAIEYSKFIRNQKHVFSDKKIKAKTLTITNNKGGVQKTTTAVNISSLLSELDNKVLLIDFDGQGNASEYALGLSEKENLDTILTLKDILLEEKNSANVKKESFEKAIIKSDFGFDIITNNILFNSARSELESSSAKELLLKRVLERLENDYDYIIIDTPPTLAFEQLNAYFASDYLLIVSNADHFSRAGIEQTYELIKSAKNQNSIYAKPKSMKLLGLVMTDVHVDTNVHKYNIEKVKEYCLEHDIFIFEEMVKSTVKVKEAIELNEPVHKYDPTSLATYAYFNIALSIDLSVKKEYIKEKLGL